MHKSSSYPRLTGIGSLPHDNMNDALDHVLRAYSLPFRPQLALGSGQAGMLSECLPAALKLDPNPGFGVKLHHQLEDPELLAIFCDSDPRAAEIVALNRSFLEAVATGQSAPALKTQMVGPVTMLQSLRDAWSRPLFSALDLQIPVASWLSAVSRCLIDDLREFSDAAILVLDEPVLGLPGPLESKEQIYNLLMPLCREISSSAVTLGIHCCSKPPLGLLERLPVDILFLDACRYAALFRSEIAALGQMLHQGRRFCLGLVPVIPEASEFDILGFLDALEQGAGMPRSDIVEALDISASCGSMMAPVERELEIADALSALQVKIQEWRDRGTL